MGSRIKRWYHGETKIHTFDNDDPDSGVVVLPCIYTEYHWTAKAARSLVAFYLRHWQWLWATFIGVATLVATIKGLK